MLCLVSIFLGRSFLGSILFEGIPSFIYKCCIIIIIVVVIIIICFCGFFKESIFFPLLFFGGGGGGCRGFFHNIVEGRRIYSFYHYP